MPRKRKSYPELEALRHLLGKVPDHEVAARAGTSASIVGRYRRSLKIDAYDGYKFGNDKPEDEVAAEAAVEVAEPVVEEVVAEEAPAAVEAAPAEESDDDSDDGATGRKSKITPFHDQVGTIPDKEVASLAGVSTEAVRMYRRRRGIELNVEKKTVKKKKRSPSRRKSRLDPYFDQLGRVPDAEIAAKAGVTPENVRAYRARHGIKADYRKRGSNAEASVPATVAAVAAAVPEVVEVAVEAAAVVVEAAVAEVAAPEETVVESAPEVAEEVVETVVEAEVAEAELAIPTSHAFAFKVEGSDETWVLLADDVAKAAMRAMGALAAIAPGGQIGSITHLGRALI